MSTRTKVILCIVGFTAIGFLLGANAPIGQMIWPPNPENPTPTAGQLPFFIVLSLVESVAFGIGITYLIFGFQAASKLAGTSGFPAVAVHLSITWVLINWVMHDSLHMHNGMDLQGLLYIEYGFHVTLILTGLVLANTVTRIVEERSQKVA